MIAAIMQPYFFPYIGYFQLMHAADIFVFFDDVQYINRGWVNRNRIRGNGEPAWLTLPVRNASRELSINRREYLLPGDDTLERVEQRLHAAYSRSPYWAEAMPLISDLLRFRNVNVAAFNAHLLTEIAQRLGIKCRFLLSSEIDQPMGLRSQARIIDLCRRVGADHYLNPVGGVELYDAASFDAAHLQLSFLRTTAMPVQLACDPRHLSIIDGLMHDGITGCGARLPEYELVAAE